MEKSLLWILWNKFWINERLNSSKCYACYLSTYQTFSSYKSWIKYKCGKDSVIPHSPEFLFIPIRENIPTPSFLLFYCTCEIMHNKIVCVQKIVFDAHEKSPNCILHVFLYQVSRQANHYPMHITISHSLSLSLSLFFCRTDWIWIITHRLLKFIWVTLR